MDKKEIIGLSIVFGLVLSLRLFLVFQTSTFDPDAYNIIRHIDFEKKNLTPLTNDELSYGGRTIVNLPAFSYIMTFFSVLFPTELVGKILPNIFACLIIFVVYLISKDLTKNKFASFVSAINAGFVPIFFAKTTNNISLYALAIPLMFFIFYCFIKINEKKDYFFYFIFSLLLLRVLHVSVILIIISLLLYLLLLKVEKIKTTRKEVELILFSTFIVMWTLFLTFKKPILEHGFSLIWRNIPKSVLSNYFNELNLFEAVHYIGIIPVLLGAYTLYRCTVAEKSKKTSLFVSFSLLIFVLLWLRLIELDIGLILLGIVFSIFLSKAYVFFFRFMGNVKISRLKNAIGILLVIIIISTSFTTSIAYTKQSLKDSVSEEELNALGWIKANTELDSVVLGTLEEGYLITAVAKRANIADKNFIMIKDASQRVDDIDLLYNTVYETAALGVLDKYKVDYILFSDIAKKKYSIEQLKFINDKCFELVYSEGIKIYKPVCVLK